MLPSDAAVIASCLAGDEAQAKTQILDNPNTAYASSKRALALWVRRTAALPEWGGEGLLLNGIGPGVIATPMTNPLFDKPDMVEALGKSNPMAVKKYAVADEVAELLTFLLSFENHYLTGQIIFIDGGTDIILRPELV
jgi:NAD(P)-dependent dehydrogenase (short-subunit alcohol dehydrogenase family)